MPKPRPAPDEPPLLREPPPPPNNADKRRCRLRTTSSRSGGPCSGLFPPPQGLLRLPPESFQAIRSRSRKEGKNQPNQRVGAGDCRNGSPVAQVCESPR